MASSADSFNVETALETVLSKLRTLAETGQTFGQPITIGETIIVPYMSLYFGLAGGGGNVNSDPIDPSHPKHPSNPKTSSTLWGGAGGGVRIEPQGFLVIRGDKVELLTLDAKSNQWGQLAEGLLPLVQQWLQSRDGNSTENGEANGDRDLPHD